MAPKEVILLGNGIEVYSCDPPSNFNERVGFYRQIESRRQFSHELLCLQRTVRGYIFDPTAKYIRVCGSGGFKILDRNIWKTFADKSICYYFTSEEIKNAVNDTIAAIFKVFIDAFADAMGIPH